MKRSLLLSTIIGAFLLSGCADINNAYDTLSSSVRTTIGSISSSDEKRPATTENLLNADYVAKNCPQVQIIGELSSLSDFADLTQQKDYNLISRVQVQEGASNCIYSAGNVRVDVKLIFESVLGPRGQELSGIAPTFQYPFFVAVADKDNNILAKEVFTATVNYTGDALRQTYFENLRQIIPIQDRYEGPQHKILVGFQLNDQQLTYNRATLALPVRVNNQTSPQEMLKIEPVTPPEETTQATQAPLSLNDKVIVDLQNRANNQLPVDGTPPL